MGGFTLVAPARVSLLGKDLRITTGGSGVRGFNFVPKIPGSESPFPRANFAHVPIGKNVGLTLGSEVTDPGPGNTRLQWGVPTWGRRTDAHAILSARIDRPFAGLIGLLSNKSDYTGNERRREFSLTPYVGARQTASPGGIPENQRVGLAGLKMGNPRGVELDLGMWNDAPMVFGPLGSEGDKLDTGGGYLKVAGLETLRHGIAPNRWALHQIAVTIRMATGVHGDALSEVNGYTYYADVRFPEIDRGDVSLGATFLKTKKQPIQTMEIGLGINSGRVRHAVQTEVIHKPLKVPGFPMTDHVQSYLYLIYRF